MSDFSVHPQLEQDCYTLGDGVLSRILLMNDSRFPWLILVPRLVDLRDLHDVPNESRSVLFEEIDATSRCVQNLINADKVNVAALGNQVPQLHVHVIGRLTSDEAWPGPVWGVGTPVPYSEDQLSRIKKSVERYMKS